MDKMGCTIKREFYKCGECPIRTGGFYDSKSGVINNYIGYLIILLFN